MIPVYRSPIISTEIFLHGFPERMGGVSERHRESLNLGYKWGDDKANVDENHRRVAEQEGYAPGDLVVTKHVHGTNVWRVGEPLPEPSEFDGLVSDRSGVVLGAFAADCVPLVFADPDARVCGAAHAGWRGTVNRAAVNVIKRMTDCGARASAVRVVLGRSSGPCCLEVGEEVC